MKNIYIAIILLSILSCEEKEEKSERIIDWQTVQNIILNDSLIIELGMNLNQYEGVVYNEVNYNLFGDDELFRNSTSLYFNYDDNLNNISNVKLNYKEIESKYNNYFNDLSFFKTNENFNILSFKNYEEKIKINLNNINKDYSIELDTLESDYLLQFESYEYNISGLFLSSIIKLNQFEMINSNKYFSIFNEDITTLRLNSLKSEIEKYYTLNDTVAFVFESHHIKYDTIHQNNKKYIIFNKEIYPIRLTYLP